MDGQRFRPRYTGAAVEWVNLLCVGGPLNGQRLSIPAGHHAYSIDVSARQTADYRVSTISIQDARYSFLTSADWTDAQAMAHLFGPPIPD